MLSKVIDLALNLHTGQTRKGSGLPFIVHPLSVMTKLRKLGTNNLSWLAAALCHDIIEDCGITEDGLLMYLPQHFDNEICNEILNIVVELTHYPILQSKEEYLQSFRDKSLQALIVKLLDRIDNVEDYGLDNPVYASKYLNKAKVLFEIYRERKGEIESCFGKEFNQLLSNEITRAWTRFDLTSRQRMV